MSGRPKAGLVNLADVEAEQVRWLWYGRIPLGKLTILDGDPGTAKTTLALDLAARVSRGDRMPDGSTSDHDGPRGAIILTAEDGLADTIRPRLDAAGADVTRIGALQWVRDSPTDPERPPTVQDVEPLREAIEKKGAALVTLDPLVAYLGGADSHNDAAVRQALTPLVRLAEETGTAVLAIRHLNKKIDVTHALYRGGGSIGFSGLARSVQIVGFDPDDPTGERRILASSKSNLAPPQVSLAYRLEVTSRGVARIEWLGPSSRDADYLVGKQEGTSAPKKAMAMKWLEWVLAGGALPVSELRERTEQAGHSWSTVQRAASQLSVQKTKLGFDKGWAWSLPEQDGEPMPTKRDLATFEEEDPEDPQNERTFSNTAISEASGHLPADNAEPNTAKETNSGHLRGSPGETGPLRGRTGEDGQDYPRRGLARVPTDVVDGNWA